MKNASNRPRSSVCANRFSSFQLKLASGGVPG